MYQLIMSPCPQSCISIPEAPAVECAAPTAEAKQSDLETAEDPAISRLRPIQDGLDLWGIHRSSGDTVSGAPAPG
jgi:hypothetical protein